MLIKNYLWVQKIEFQTISNNFFPYTPLFPKNGTPIIKKKSVILEKNYLHDKRR